eukprot:3761705-Prymnesium_polylepis.1
MGCGAAVWRTSFAVKDPGRRAWVGCARLDSILLRCSCVVGGWLINASHSDGRAPSSAVWRFHSLGRLGAKQLFKLPPRKLEAVPKYWCTSPVTAVTQRPC